MKRLTPVWMILLLAGMLSAQDKDKTAEPPANASKGKINQNRDVGEIVVNVTKDGSITVEGEKLTEGQLLAKLQLIASVHKDQAVILRADENSLHKDNVAVLNLCQKAGIWNISFAKRATGVQPEK